MRLGLGLPSMGTTVGDAAGTATFAARAEELGYDSLWLGDRMITPVDPSSTYPGGDDAWRAISPIIARSADPLLVVAAAMTATRHVRFGFSTFSAPLFHPVPLARSLTTLDVLSGGRLDAGFGLSWLRDEYDAVGVPWAERGRRLDDLLTFLDVWWTEEVVGYEGPFFTMPKSRVDLRPVQGGGPPVYLGGVSEAALRRVGRRATGWLGLEGPAPWLAQLWATVQRAAEGAGRDPDSVRRVIRVNAEPGESVMALVERLDTVAASGADEAVLELLLTGLGAERQLDVAERVAELRSW